MKEKEAVVLLSGGIDSSTTFALAKSEGYELYALSFDYNQRHKRELESAQMVAEALGAKRHLIMTFDLQEIGGSALTSDIEVPRVMKGIQGETGTQRGKNFLNESPSHRISASGVIPVTYVPARNTIFLSFALAWAEVLEVEDIFIGANTVDYSGYPDCRPEYFWAFEDMANLATKASVEGQLRYTIQAPLIAMRKSEIIRTGIKLGLDYALTWSCYDPQPVNPSVSPLGKGGYRGVKGGNERSNVYVPCGLCDSCLYRAKGFKEAGIEDPLIKP